MVISAGKENKAGPCVLPQQAIDNAIEALKDFKGTGVPVISISHRTKEWEAVMDECRGLWRELLNIPEDYEILFLGGGASMGFLYVAMNFFHVISCVMCFSSNADRRLQSVIVGGPKDNKLFYNACLMLVIFSQ